MKLIDQVCTPEQANKLKALGVCQGANAYYDIRYDEPELFMPSFWTFRKNGVLQNTKEAAEYYLQKGLIVAAFTVAELGAMLPAGYDTMFCTGEGWRGYDHDGNDFQVETFKTEAECRASMLIELLQRNIVTIKEVNARLCANQ